MATTSPELPRAPTLFSPAQAHRTALCSTFLRNPAAPFLLLHNRLASAPPRAPTHDEEAQVHHHHASAAPDDANWPSLVVRLTQRLLRLSRQWPTPSSDQLSLAPANLNQSRPTPIQLTQWFSVHSKPLPDLTITFGRRLLCPKLPQCSRQLEQRIGTYGA